MAKPRSGVSTVRTWMDVPSVSVRPRNAPPVVAVAVAVAVATGEAAAVTAVVAAAVTAVAVVAAEKVAE
ncbi:MAG: hypothetical protein VYA46_09425, partial [Verrucomicrobiota bacterium]|nr:hypothetical protein [Verrucomicrobiota bacterium]